MMPTRLADELDPRDLGDRLDGIESRIETLQDNERRHAGCYEQPLRQALSDAQQARRAASVSQALTVAILFMAVVAVALVIRSNADLKWDLYLERTRSESLANRVGQLRAQLTQAHDQLEHAHELLVATSGGNETMSHGSTYEPGDPRTMGLLAAQADEVLHSSHDHSLAHAE